MGACHCNFTVIIQARKPFHHDQLSLLVQSIQVCVKTMPQRKDISDDLKGTNVGAHPCVKIYTSIFKQLGDHLSTMRKIIHEWKENQSSQKWVDQQVHPKVRPCDAQRHEEKTPKAASQTPQAVLTEVSV